MIGYMPSQAKKYAKYNRMDNYPVLLWSVYKIKSNPSHPLNYLSDDQLISIIDKYLEWRLSVYDAANLIMAGRFPNEFTRFMHSSVSSKRKLHLAKEYITPEEIRILKEEYNITWPERCSRTMVTHLIRHLEEGIDKTRPVAVMALAKSDYNGAFRTPEIYDDLIGGYNVFLYEVETDEELVEACLKVSEKYGVAIDLLIIGGHGNKSRINLKSMDISLKMYIPLYSIINYLKHMRERYSIDKSDIEQLRRLRNVLSREALAVLMSCSTAEGERSIAQAICDALGRKTFAANKISYGTIFHLNLQDGLVTDVEFSGRDGRVDADMKEILTPNE